MTQSFLEWGVELGFVAVAALIVFIAARLFSGIYERKGRDSAWGFAAMFASWIVVVLGILTVFVWSRHRLGPLLIDGMIETRREELFLNGQAPPALKNPAADLSKQ